MSPRVSDHEGRFAVLVDGHDTFGFIKSVSGGTLRGSVVVDDLAIANVLRKRISSKEYDNFSIEAGMGAPDGFMQWISSSLKKGQALRNGEFHACDLEGKSMSVREFVDAYIEEVTFPELDGQSNDPAFITVKIKSAPVRSLRGDGKQIQAKTVPSNKRIKASRFRLNLGNLPCGRVSKIGSLSWNLKHADKTDRLTRLPADTISKWTEVSNLKLTVNFQDFHPWDEWVRKFLYEGDVQEELDGSIELLSEDLQQTLVRIDLAGCGPVLIDFFAHEVNKEDVARFIVELYVNEVGFEAQSVAV